MAVYAMNVTDTLLAPLIAMHIVNNDPVTSAYRWLGDRRSEKVPL